MKNKIFRISIITVFAIAILFIIRGDQLTNSQRQNNGFMRILFKHVLIQRQILNCPTSIERFAGADRHGIYWQSHSANQLLYIDLHPNATIKSIPLPFPLTQITNNAFHLSVQGNDIYLFGYDYPSTIQVYNRITGQTFVNTLSQGYTRHLSISHCSFVLRQPDSLITDQQFNKILFEEHERVQESYFKTRVNGDGGFATDGELYYDQDLHHIIYTYFYQNGFVCLDSNLNFLYKAKTLNTVYHTSVKGIRRGVFGQGYFTLMSAPKYVSGKASVANQRLYLESFLKADNEQTNSFRKNTVIDVYSVSNGGYEGSFYLPSLNEKKADQFLVYNQVLIAAYQSKIVIYDLPL